MRAVVGRAIALTLLWENHAMLNEPSGIVCVLSKVGDLRGGSVCEVPTFLASCAVKPLTQLEGIRARVSQEETFCMDWFLVLLFSITGGSGGSTCTAEESGGANCLSRSTWANFPGNLRPSAAS